jgi:hypothetical protein
MLDSRIWAFPQGSVEIPGPGVKAEGGSDECWVLSASEETLKRQKVKKSKRRGDNAGDAKTPKWRKKTGAGGKEG